MVLLKIIFGKIDTWIFLRIVDFFSSVLLMIF